MRIKWIIVVVFVVAIGGVAFKISQALKLAHNTGLLKVTTSDPDSTIAISRNSSQAVYIGQGSAKVRLDQGTYLVSASNNGTTVMSSTGVTDGQTSQINLDIAGQVKKEQYYGRLTTNLPSVGPAFTYKIDYYMTYANGQGVPVLTITAASDKAYQSALSWLRSVGINPSDFKIKVTKAASVPTNYNYFVGG